MCECDTASRGGHWTMARHNGHKFTLIPLGTHGCCARTDTQVLGASYKTTYDKSLLFLRAEKQYMYNEDGRQ